MEFLHLRTKKKEMTYQETLAYLYTKTPVFHQVGAEAYKPGLQTALHLDAWCGHPHQAYRTIHVAGTNGKGSTCHTLAAIFQEAGYKTGLYTSPHLKDFDERIRVNGRPISHDYVKNFVSKAGEVITLFQPSFFELTTLMAFCWFRDQQVDVAIIETGLGGRLDTTNIITPVLSIITNVSLDHTAQLGSSLESIAKEKAGIIKPGVPVVVGEADSTLLAIYKSKNSPVLFAPEVDMPESLDFSLKGLCQNRNKRTIYTAYCYLRSQFRLPKSALYQGLSQVVELTGLQGRWQQLRTNPMVIADTAHNEGAFRYIVAQLGQQSCDTMRIVIGMMKDKDIRAVLTMLPKQAVYYFSQADTPRALSSSELQQVAQEYGLQGQAYASTQAAYHAALHEASPRDFIYVGGSNFVVCDVL